MASVLVGVSSEFVALARMQSRSRSSMSRRRRYASSCGAAQQSHQVLVEEGVPVPPKALTSVSIPPHAAYADENWLSEGGENAKTKTRKDGFRSARVVLAFNAVIPLRQS